MIHQTQIYSNVMKFILALHQTFDEARSLSIRCLQVFEDHKISSPIEQMFLSAMEYLLIKNNCRYDRPVPFSIDGKTLHMRHGIIVSPQDSIGEYRVDFRVQYYHKCVVHDGQILSGRYDQIIVELDSKEFHDRDEEDRVHEKERGRYLVKQGYKLIRFTGTEVFKDPVAKASEALEILTGIAFHKESDSIYFE